jgi:hypothetical protein
MMTPRFVRKDSAIEAWSRRTPSPDSGLVEAAKALLEAYDNFGAEFIGIAEWELFRAALAAHTKREGT